MNIKDILKKIVSNKEARLNLVKLLTSHVSDEAMVKFLWHINYGKEKLNLENPQTFNEKLQWYKLYYHDNLMTQCSDKYLVRDYVKKCGLSHILTPIYSVYEKVEDISFETLPDECFIKCTHNSNGNILWRKNESLNDVIFIKKKLNRMLKNNAYYSSREWSYKNIKPRIICEKLLKSDDSNGLVDYNFFCFDGKPKLVMYNIGLSDEKGEHSIGKRAVLDMNFDPINITTSMNPLDSKFIKKPNNFSDMIKYAQVLSKPFPHVRVDFFYVNGEIRFGELTFYSAGGYVKLEPKKWQYIIGDWMKLPQRKM
jgi:hypothetical protein